MFQQKSVCCLTASLAFRRVEQHLNELQDAVSRVLTFVLMDRGAVEDDRGGVGLDVVLKSEEISVTLRDQVLMETRAEIP